MCDSKPAQRRTRVQRGCGHRVLFFFVIIIIICSFKIVTDRFFCGGGAQSPGLHANATGAGGG